MAPLPVPSPDQAAVQQLAAVPQSGERGAPESTPPWYLAYTKPRQEMVAQLNLRQQGFETYLPLFKVLRRGAAGPVMEPMFPRYLLLRPGREGQSLGTVRSTRGVSGLVRFGVEPGTLAERVVNGIRAAEVARAQLDDAALQGLRAGQTVVFAGGPFQGLAGLVTSVSAQRVRVLLELLGRPTQVQVAPAELAPA